MMEIFDEAFSQLRKIDEKKSPEDAYAAKMAEEEEKIEKGRQTGKRNGAAASEDKLRIGYNICIRKGYDEDAQKILDIAHSRNLLMDITSVEDTPRQMQLDVPQTEQPEEQTVEIEQPVEVSDEEVEENPEFQQLDIDDIAVEDEPETADDLNSQQLAEIANRTYKAFFDFGTTGVVREPNSDKGVHKLTGKSTKKASDVRSKISIRNPNFIYMAKVTDNGVDKYTSNIYQALNVAQNKGVEIVKVANNTAVKSAIQRRLETIDNLQMLLGDENFTIPDFINAMMSGESWDANTIIPDPITGWSQAQPVEINQIPHDDFAQKQIAVDANKQRHKEGADRNKTI